MRMRRRCAPSVKDEQRFKVTDVEQDATGAGLVKLIEVFILEQNHALAFIKRPI